MEAHQKPAFRLTINTKLLIVLLGLSVVLLAFSAYMAFNSMAILGNYALTKQTALRDFAVTNSIEALQKQAENNLKQLAEAQAVISNNFFSEIEAELDMMTQTATHLWKNPAAFGTTFPSYTKREKPVDVNQAAVYTLAPGVTFDAVKEQLALSSHLDNLFAAVRANNQNIAGPSVTLEAGLDRTLPWIDSVPDGWDARVRPWYQAAMKQGKLIWVKPYLDASSGDLMTTCAKPFYTPKNELIGVISSDIKTTTLVKQIISTQVGEGGSAFLIDQDGDVIASPELSAQKTSPQKEPQTINLLKTDDSQMQAAAQKMVQGEKGLLRAQFKDGEKYLAYAPVPRTGWSLGVVMPVEKIIASALTTKEEITQEAQKTEQEINRQQASVRSIMIMVFVIMIIAVSGLTYALSKRITKPILALHDGVRTVGNGNLDYKITVKTGDELEDLADAFNKMTDDLKHYIKDLETTTAAKKKIETELDIARSIQAGLLPQTLPQLPDWEIEAYFWPARQVAGDFYDMFPIEGGRKFFFVVADVCDKGVGPAMFAAIIRTLLRAFSDNYTTSAALESSHLPLIRTNDFTIANQTESNMFATTFAGVFDPETHSVSYINCGHNPPYVIGADHKIRAALKPTGPILGVFPGVQYKMESVTLEPGETLFVFTDGVPEAHDLQGQLLNDHRLREILEQPSASAAEILQRVEQGVRAHIGTADQFDDITMLLIRRKPEHTS